MSFTPLHDRVLVRHIDAEPQTAGGLFIPDSAREKPQEGRSHRGRRRCPFEIRRPDLGVSQAGQPDSLRQMSGSEIRMDGEDLIVMHESDILGVIA